jgi:hypothetical protein
MYAGRTKGYEASGWSNLWDGKQPTHQPQFGERLVEEMPMPRISQFHGVSIYMYYFDHPPPHFHAIHGDDEALITIAPPGLQRGYLPGGVLKRVLEWAALHQAALMDNWQLAQSGQPSIKSPHCLKWRVCHGTCSHQTG